MEKETKKSRKLTLNRETLRNLSAQELSIAHGGDDLSEVCKSVTTGYGGDVRRGVIAMEKHNCTKGD
jgi:hypothetical protein